MNKKLKGLLPNHRHYYPQTFHVDEASVDSAKQMLKDLNNQLDKIQYLLEQGNAALLYLRRIQALFRYYNEKELSEQHGKQVVYLVEDNAMITLLTYSKGISWVDGIKATTVKLLILW